MGQQSPRAAKLKQLALTAVCLSACIGAAVGLVSCQGSPIKPYRQAFGPAGISVCDIVAHKNSYIGKTVEISALWKTDNLNYGYFEDIEHEAHKCQAGNIIQLGYISKMHDKSVVGFFNVGKRLCNAKNKPISCTQTAYVRFIATILSDKDGLYVHLDKILSYKYLPQGAGG